MPDTPRNYYDVLGVHKSTTQDEIKKAYRRLARKYHPDLHPGPQKTEMERKFKELNEAYEVLNNEETRKKYDQFGPQWKEAEAYQHARQQAESEPTGSEWQRVFSEEAGTDFREVFENLFGRQARGRGPSSRGFAMPGADLETTARITLQEVFTGTTRRLELLDPSGQPQTLDIRIPKGVQDGARVRVKGKGAPGMDGGARGDLYLRIQLDPHPVFQRQGSNLYVPLPIWPWEAALGAEVQVPTLTGTVRLKIPPGSQSKQKLRLKGKGLPTRSGGYGEQFAILEVIMPSSISDRERSLYEQMGKLDHPDPRLHLLKEASHG